MSRNPRQSYYDESDRDWEPLTADALERIRESARIVAGGGSHQPAWWMIGGLLHRLDAARALCDATIANADGRDIVSWAKADEARDILGVLDGGTE